MANRVATPNLFAPSSPNWSLALLDANSQAAAGAINDSSLGASNGPLADTGSVNAYSVTCSYGTPSAYNNGMTVFFTPGNTNTGASTLTVSPLSSMSIVSASGSALTGGELIAGNTVGVVCDGTAFRIFSVSTTAITSQIWSTRLRSFNAIGNPNFEVTQRNCAAIITNPGTGGVFIEDRWQFGKTGTYTVNCWCAAPGQRVVIPGTNYLISDSFFHFVLTGQETTMAAGDYMVFQQYIEGPLLRELLLDVHSVSLLVRASVGPLNFGLSICDPTGSRSLCKLCTIPSANTWTLLQFPNIPVFPGAGTFSVTPGSLGYIMRICLASGSTFTAPANDTWQTGNFQGASGQDNFASKPVNTTFDCAFIQHEPGSVCTTLMDKPFTQNYDECLRYYCKSYPYGTKAATASIQAGLRSVTVIPQSVNITHGDISFPKVMAKAPTVTSYAYDGSINSLLSVGGANAAVSSVGQVSEYGFNSFTMASSLTANNVLQFHYVADTGW